MFNSDKQRRAMFANMFSNKSKNKFTKKDLYMADTLHGVSGVKPEGKSVESNFGTIYPEEGTIIEYEAEDFEGKPIWRAEYESPLVDTYIVGSSEPESYKTSKKGDMIKVFNYEPREKFYPMKVKPVIKDLEKKLTDLRYVPVDDENIDEYGYILQSNRIKFLEDVLQYEKDPIVIKWALDKIIKEEQ